MPGPLYRMHGAVTGAYDIANVDVINRVVLTNKMPASLIRGFGGPQLYLALERLVQRIAIELELDHLDVIKRNLVPKEKFPYKAAAGALYDSGDYLRAVETAAGEGRLADLERRRDAARAAGRHYGIGFAVVIEPGMSNMGYLSTLLTPEARDKAGPKNGAVSMVTVNVDPLGAVSVTADVTVQGQGHATVLSQIVADRLGLTPDDINVVLEMDTAKDQWSIAAGTYSCRFTPGTAVAAHLAGERMADKLKAIAAKQLNVLPEDVELVAGKIRSRSNPDNALPFGRVAGTSHWSPVMLPDGMAPALRETAVWSPPELEPPSSDDRINTSLTYGFVFDICGIEIDPLTYQVRVDRYISIHDAGRILNPMIAEGQLRGSFAQGIASALYEEFVYDDSGQFLTGTFADYLVPTVSEIPHVEILHQETPSPFTPLGAKGMAEGNCMSTPACIANAIADALGVKDVTLPATPRRIHAMMAGPEADPPKDPSPAAGGGQMKPKPFDYARPDTVEEAVAILAEHGDDARVLAGGQTLLAMLNLRVVEPAVLVDITRIPELGVIREVDGKIEVGAAVTQNRLLAWPALAQKLPLLAAALPFVGHFQTRNKGTVCGSVAHADPTSEIPLSLAVLEGEVVLRSREGTRVLPASEFQQGMLATARAGDELITAVRFPVVTGGVAFRETARRHGDFAIVGVAALAAGAGTAFALASPAWRIAPRFAASRRTARPASRMRSSGSPGSSRATRTSMRPRACGAISCAASVRSSSRRPSDAPREQGRAREIEPDAQRPQAVGRGRAAHAAERFSPPCARRDRHPCRMRARRLRLLHGAARRRGRALLPDARGAGRGQGGDDGGIARRRQRQAQRAAAGVPEQSRAAMRVLHARHPDVVHRFPRAQSRSDRGRGGGGAQRPSLPLYRLRRHRRRRARSGGTSQEIRADREDSRLDWSKEKKVRRRCHDGRVRQASAENPVSADRGSPRRLSAT